MEPEKMASVRRMLIPVLLAGSCWAQNAESAKPACNEQTLGSFWPEKADQRPGMPVEICSKAHRKYHWLQLTVDVSQLKGTVKGKPDAVPVAVAARSTGSADAKPVIPTSE
ncbi:MAG TPA: hypothetical protein VHY84_10030 [Bryobacteraceae bacterium]|jgi:hypothetical protein|nr:hypothetical protein [Bryobacteraceae bacterium]